MLIEINKSIVYTQYKLIHKQLISGRFHSVIFKELQEYLHIRVFIILFGMEQLVVPPLTKNYIVLMILKQNHFYYTEDGTHRKQLLLLNVTISNVVVFWTSLS